MTQANGQQAIQPTARLLQYFYQGLLGNFEELYRKNAAEQTRKTKAMGQNMVSPMRPGDATSRVVSGNQQAGPSGSQPGGGAVGNMNMGQQSNVQSAGPSTNGAPSFPMQGPPSPHRPATPTMHGSLPAIEGDGQFSAQTGSTNILDHEQDSLGKRKLELEEADLKRARQKTGISQHSSDLSAKCLILAKQAQNHPRVQQHRETEAQHHLTAILLELALPHLKYHHYRPQYSLNDNYLVVRLSMHRWSESWKHMGDETFVYSRTICLSASHFEMSMSGAKLILKPSRCHYAPEYLPKYPMPSPPSH